MNRRFIALLAGIGMLVLSSVAGAQVHRIELDVTGYLCGL